MTKTASAEKMTTSTKRVATAINSKSATSGEAGTFTKRIGFTTYRVGVHFSGSNKETAQDKITRLIRMESQNGKAAGQ